MTVSIILCNKKCWSRIGPVWLIPGINCVIKETGTFCFSTLSPPGCQVCSQLSLRKAARWWSTLQASQWSWPCPCFIFIFINEESYPRNLPQHQRPTGPMKCPVQVLLTRFTLRLWMGCPFLKGGQLNKTVFLFARKQREMAIIVLATYDLIQCILT